MAEIKFKCKRCGCEILEEVLTGIIQTTVISVIDSSGAVDYDSKRVSYDGGEVERYQCHKCGHPVKDFRKVEVGNPGWLAEVLQGIGAEDYNAVRESYSCGVCPDCNTPIPTDVIEGQSCAGCPHVFYEQRYADDLDQQLRE